MSSAIHFVPALFALLLAIAALTAAVIAHRGKKFWGTWMMLVAGVGTLLGAFGLIVAQVLFVRALGASGSPSSFESYHRITMIAALLRGSSILIYLVGMLGLAIRYSAVHRRVDELETITSSLMERK